MVESTIASDEAPITRLVMGNWKMNGRLQSNAELLRKLLALHESQEMELELSSAQLHSGHKFRRVQIAVCPPFPYLAQVAQELQDSSITWGAQDVSLQSDGAFTGEVAAGMLNDFKCTWVIVGHSERRNLHGETSEQVAAKAKQALEHHITPVVCVGETLQQRESGHALAVISDQLAPVVALGSAVVTKLVIAYEPVWAIGTGLTATPEQAQEVHAHIRSILRTAHAPNVQILYGGSVKAANAASLFKMPDINGALVGGVALNAKEFLAIAGA